ncbi:MAG: hypothetical protein QG608_3568 [Actinomycetota bacterium]|nr:hypothetical protein [Actinomycetota bacterium]
MSTRSLFTQAGALALCTATLFAPQALAEAEVAPTLTGIRAGHQPATGTSVARDRLVFDFDGPLPAHRSARWVSEPRYRTPDVSEVGLVPISGNAYLEVTFHSVLAHEEATGLNTYGATSRAFDLPNIMQVVNNDDFEHSVSFLAGVSAKKPFRMFTLTSPSRLVIDLDADLQTVPASAFFQDLPAYQAGRPDDVRSVTRQVVPPATAKGALQRLFAGPTAVEQQNGLRFVSSGAKGFSNLSITAGVAKVRLTGGCNSGGSTFTIAKLIVPTLRQFSTVSAVKIYDPNGTTENPTGPGDSLPECLEP